MDASSLRLSPKQADCLQAYQAIRSYSLALIQNLSAEDCSLQAAAFVSPAKWHLAHTTWFFETFILIPHVEGYQPFHKDFQVLFNSYYNGIGEQFSRPKRHLLSRPSLDQVVAYRQHIDAHMQLFLEQASGDDQALVMLGLNHEQQHQELLLMDLKYCFFQNPLYPSYAIDSDTFLVASTELKTIAPIQFVSFEQALIDMGVDNHIVVDQSHFYFDNETPAHKTYVQKFQLADRLVTNGEYLQFIDDGAYDDASIWLSDGWAWLAAVKKEIPAGQDTNSACAPLYWVKKDNQWFEFSMQGLQPLDLYAPVRHVNFYESLAYAQWSGCRLATEAEWEHGVKQSVKQILRESADLRKGQAAIKQVDNEVWQWTQSAYQPYPGFKKPEGAVGEYNGKFMCNQMVLRGGCQLTSPDHTRATYRNFFYPQDQWPMTGIRLAKDA
jgi:ergothioneine biosynthesis protein EgtB